MTDDKCGQHSFELSVGVTSDLTYGCPQLARVSLGVEKLIRLKREVLASLVLLVTTVNYTT